MDAQTKESMESFNERGRLQFAAWNDDLFRAYAKFFDAIVSAVRNADRPGVEGALLALTYEGIGAGTLATALTAAPANFLELALRQWLPTALIAESNPLALLVRIWNLSDGLRR